MSSTNGSVPAQGRGPAAPGQVTYAGTAEQSAEQRAQDLIAQDPQLQGVIGLALHPGVGAAAKASADAEAVQYASSQTRSLGQDIETTRGPDTGGHNYLAYQQQQLHDMVNSNADPSGVNEQGQTFADIGNEFADLTDTLNKATATASVSWQGKAAAAGAAFTAGMSAWHAGTAQGAQYAGTQMFEQSQALSQARAAMPVPMATPTTADFQQALLSFNPIDPSSISAVQNLASQAQAAQANHQMMARVAEQYDSHLGTSATMPSFSTPQQFSVNPPAATGSPTGPVASGTARSGHVPSTHPTRGASTVDAASPGRVGITGGNAGPSAPPQLPSASGATGSTTTQGTGGYSPPGVPAGSGSGSSGAASGAGEGFGMPVGGGSGFGPMYSGAGAGVTGGGYGGIGVPARRGFGAVEDEAPGVGGPRSAAGAGAAVEEEAAEALPGSVRESSPLAGGLGAGRTGRGGEDGEHKRPGYLLADDPDELFGSDEKTIPPVIGL